MTPPSEARAEAPASRQRVADQVFEAIARSILAGERRPGEPLETHRELARHFDVSPVLVRQAIHRLEDLQLVRVRHGSGTVVLDPARSTDIRMLQLRIELAEPNADVAATVLEVQTLGVVPMLVLAERRMSEAALARLRTLTAELSPEASSGEIRRFVQVYWREIAAATNNPYFAQQVRWWWRLVAELRRRQRKVPLPGAPAEVHAAYCALTEALAARRGSAQVYCNAIEPLLQWLDQQRAASGHAR